MLELIRGLISKDIEYGYTTEAEIVESIQGHINESYGIDYFLEHIEQITADLLTARQELESKWIKPTDCDKLDKAFAELEESGILTRQCFTCCQTCGHYEILDEIKAQVESGRQIDGYCFFHRGDVEEAPESNYLYLAYGSTVRGEREMREVANRIIKALRDNGFEPNWNGSLNKRIGFEVVWQKRFFEVNNV